MKKALTLILIICLLLSGCGAAGTENSTYINVSTSNTVMSLDNSVVSDAGSGDVLNITTSRLFKFDEAGNILPELAESYEVSPDGLTYIFHLRDCLWNDGTPITADDFVFTFERIATNGGAYNNMLVEPMCIKNASEVIFGDSNGNKLPPDELGVYADDDKTLRIELSTPVTFLTNILTFAIFCPVKRAFFESLEPGVYGSSPETYLCSGPFELSEYIPGTTCIVFKKNEHYYDSENINLAGIKYHIITSQSSAMEAFKVGDLDIINLSGSNVVYAKGDEKTAPYLISSPGDYLCYMTFNMDPEKTNPALLNKNFRFALMKSIDKQKIVDSALNGGGQVSSRLIPTYFSYSQTTGEDFAADQDIYSDILEYDAAEALRLFELAKTELGEDSFKITLFFRGTTFFTKYAQIIQQQITQTLPGVSIELYPLSAGENSALRSGGEFDLYMSTWGPDYLDPMTYMSLWTENSSLNYGAYRSDDYNQLISDCITGQYANDYDKRWEALKEAEGVILNDGALFPILTQDQNNLVSSRIKNFKKNANSEMMYAEMEKQ